ncbi:MAG TPA: hypothetical protein VM118_09235, partial [Acidobacteriota bacterium]|nr:hypothetical protein [Acidobacteriota bacterium]
MRNPRSICLGSGLLIGAVLTLCTVPVQADTTIEIKDLSTSEMEVAYLTVDRDLTVKIEAVGGEYKSGAGMFAYAWMIDANSRNLVWSMDEEITEEVPDSPLLRSYKDDIRLRRGSYELYYFAGSPSNIFSDLEFGNLSDFFINLGEAIERLKGYYDEETKEINLSSRMLTHEYHVSVTGNSEFLHETDDSTGRTPVVAILKPENDAYRHVPFALTEDTQLDVYAIGEYWVGKGAMVDWG